MFKKNRKPQQAFPHSEYELVGFRFWEWQCLSGFKARTQSQLYIRHMRKLIHMRSLGFEPTGKRQNTVSVNIRIRFASKKCFEIGARQYLRYRCGNHQTVPASNIGGLGHKGRTTKEVNKYRMSDIVLQTKGGSSEGKANQGSSLFPIDDNRVHESNRAFKGFECFLYML